MVGVRVGIGTLTPPDAELVEPASWAGLFGAADGWSGGLGLDAEIYG
jgi:hypothetical protein